MSKTFWIAFFAKILQAVMIILGAFVVVPLAIPFGHYEKNFAGEDIYRLPFWALWCDNCFDGADGDNRGWWARNCATDAWFGWFPNLKSTDYLARWWWLAFRNPTNYFGRMVIGIDASQCVLLWVKGDKTITDKAGKNGFYLAKWQYKDMTFYSVEICIDWLDGTAFYAQFGYKVKPSKNYSQLTDITRFKSMTCEVNFKKDIS